MQILMANVLDKNEKCLNNISVIEDNTDEPITSVKSFWLSKDRTTYKCCMCGETHDLKDALFSRQRLQQWHGETDSCKIRGEIVIVPRLNTFAEPCGEDEFTAKYVQSNRIPTYEPGVSQ